MVKEDYRGGVGRGKRIDGGGFTMEQGGGGG